MLREGDVVVVVVVVGFWLVLFEVFMSHLVCYFTLDEVQIYVHK